MHACKGQALLSSKRLATSPTLARAKVFNEFLPFGTAEV
jgi:hypothetical protein